MPPHNGVTKLDVTHIEAAFASLSTPPNTQFWANILAHEVIWLNAGGNHDQLSGPDGEIASSTGAASTPFTISSANRVTLINEFKLK
jgi:hypothetical protein